MGKYLVGFILGAAASWFWFYKLNPVRGFRQILSREMGKGDPFEWAHRLDRRMENFEQRCRRLEAKITYAVAETAGSVELNGHSRPGNRRGQVIRLWKEGCSPEEIIRTTGLAKSEVELIISLKDRRLKAENN